MSEYAELTRAVCDACAQDDHANCEPVVTDGPFPLTSDCRCLHDGAFELAGHATAILMALQVRDFDKARSDAQAIARIAKTWGPQRGRVINLGARIAPRAAAQEYVSAAPLTKEEADMLEALEDGRINEGTA